MAIMGAWNFQRRFAYAVAMGAGNKDVAEQFKDDWDSVGSIKRQTIRKRRRDRDPCVGETMSLFTGQRTRNCINLGTGIVDVKMPIEIKAWLENDNLVGQMAIAGSLVSRFHADVVARRDGFRDVNELLGWMKANHPSNNCNCEVHFEGFVYRWSPLPNPSDVDVRLGFYRDGDRK